MSLHEDLRKQAWHLASRERSRPTQASLRRAVSAGYYALFHLLIDEATGMMFGQAHERRAFRHALARAFTHQSMAAACKGFGSASLPATLAVALPTSIPADLKQVAQTFVDLQDARHRADYNLAEPFLRSEVRAHLQDLDDAFEAWKRVRNDPAARFFLMALPLWPQLRGR